MRNQQFPNWKVVYTAKYTTAGEGNKAGKNSSLGAANKYHGHLASHLQAIFDRTSITKSST
jgi:hypothetical protein